MATDEFVLFAGTANPDLARRVALELGTPLGLCSIRRHPDGEVDIRLEESVRGRAVVLLQSTSPPVDPHLMELLALADACRRAAATRVTAVVPYFGYARSDRRERARSPITASLVATLIQAAGIDHLVTVDLHAAQIEGFFHIPVDALSAVPVLCDELRERLPPGVVVVSPDTGRVRAATEYAQRLETSVVVLHKQRRDESAAAVTHVVGDVRDRPCLVIDDMISTGGTIVAAAEALRAAGARPGITVAATHGLLLEGAMGRMSRAGVGELVVTDSVGVPPAGREGCRLCVVSLAPLLAAAIEHDLGGRAPGRLP